MPSIKYTFDGKNLAAQARAKKAAAKLVKNVSRETKLALRSIILKAIRDGIPPYDAARMIRDTSIGLTEQQALAVANYRQALIDGGLPIDKVEKEAKKLADRKRKERALTIARSEIVTSLNEGINESWKQAQKKGMLPKTAMKEWIVTPDEKLCEVCEPMDGKLAPIGGAFKGAPGPPAHPRCRCTVGINLSGIEVESPFKEYLSTITKEKPKKIRRAKVVDEAYRKGKAVQRKRKRVSA